MEDYLARMFNHGATLTNVFGWGVGDSANLFCRAAESADSIAAYRKFLRPAQREAGHPIRQWLGVCIAGARARAMADPGAHTRLFRLDRKAFGKEGRVAVRRQTAAVSNSQVRAASRRRRGNIPSRRVRRVAIHRDRRLPFYRELAAAGSRRRLGLLRKNAAKSPPVKR
jgi:hypothetical protein